MEIEQVLTQNNQALDTKEAELRGRIEILNEELIKIRAKREHNHELLTFIRQQKQNVSNNNSTIPSSEE